jgi:hypothetical protein
LTSRYLLAAEEVLVDQGVPVIPMSDGSYADRHARARSYKAGVYIAGHLNAGPLDARGADYGAIFYDARSSSGKRLAKIMAQALLEQCPELSDVRAVSCRDDRGEPDAWLWRPWSTIEGVYRGTPVGVCYEPAFVTCRKHRTLFTGSGLRRIGLALALGVLRFYR